MNAEIKAKNVDSLQFLLCNKGKSPLTATAAGPVSIGNEIAILYLSTYGLHCVDVHGTNVMWVRTIYPLLIV